jgi:hypothetical protein
MRIRNIGPNQVEIQTTQGHFFFSYLTCVAGFSGVVTGNNRKAIFKTSEKHSKTTSRHINAYLRDIAPEAEVQVVSQEKIDRVVNSI